MTMVAFLPPASVTITRKRRLQLVPAGKVPMQLLHCQKSPPATMLLITRSAVPTFVTVTDLTEVVVPTNWLPQLREVIESCTAGACTFTFANPVGIIRTPAKVRTER